MKKIFIMSIITMLSSLSSCQAQNKGYKSLSADDYEKAIADTA
ncbi:MAG: rhodanese-like domain-containing protein, partial [Prevotella copri]|nr:rhodanese-like domain-containing protein [Segatella copri]